MVGYDLSMRRSGGRELVTARHRPHIGRSCAAIAAWLACGVRRIRLAGAIVGALVLVCSSTAFAAPWSAPDPIDPSIGASSVSCSSASFCVAVGSASAFGSAVVYRDGSWSEASLIVPREQLFSVSCTSPSFCMALDGSGGALVYNGSGWGAPTPIGTDLTSVSCVSSSFCVAVGSSEDASVYNGSMWSAPSGMGLRGVRAVSCASESFCMAVGSFNGEAGYASVFNGSSWSAPTEIDSNSNPALSSVSCGSPSFCVTVGNFGDEETYSNGAWGAPTVVGKEGYIQSVSCHSESFCVAISPGGEAVTYNDGTWSSTGNISEQAVGAVSCPTGSFCIAIGGYSSTYNGSNWTSPAPVGGGGLSSVSCSSPSLCTAVDFHGRVLNYDGAMWSAPSEIDPEGGLDSVSCPSTAFCLAAGGRRQHSYALTFDGSAWSAPSEIDPEGGLDSVSCASASFCIAVTEHRGEGYEHGYALTYSGGVWSAPSEIDGETALVSVSCASESFCVAVGGHDAVIYSDGSWGPPSQMDADGNLRGVSCTSASFCAATVEHYTPAWAIGETLIYNGLTWSAPSEIPRAPDNGPFDIGSISCVTSSFCMAAGRFEGAATTFENGAWSPWVELEINGHFSSVSCPAVAFCVVVNDTGQAFAYGTPPPPPPPPSSSSSPPPPPPRQSGGSSATTGTHGSATPNPLVERGKSHINSKTGEITLEYDFPEPGEVEASGEVINKTSTEAKHEQAKKCESGYVREGKKCVKGSPVRYGRTRLAIITAGTYKLRIKPSAVVLTALRQGETLAVRVTVVFTPTGTADHISKMTTVVVHLNRTHKATHRAKSKRQRGSMRE
jgi:hypothetical protein